VTDLIRIARPVDDATLARAFAANAVSLIGLSAADQLDRYAWEEILGPVSGRWDLDRPFRATRAAAGGWRTQGLSTCGLVAEGVWRRMRVDLPSLYATYVPGQAIARAVTCARKHGAWRTPRDGAMPGEGDYAVIGSGLATHALTVVAVDDDVVTSVDGGQVGERGLQAVKECRRPWVWVDARRATLGGRTVLGWCACTRLPARDPWCWVPAGWEV
jgi:hypothetical protein